MSIILPDRGRTHHSIAVFFETFLTNFRERRVCELRLKRYSRKFKVASDLSSAAPSTRERHGVSLTAPKRGDYVPFVASSRIKVLRLVTVQLPENSWSI